MVNTSVNQKDYAAIKIPRSLATEVDKLIGKHGFTSRAEIVKQALRELLREYKPTQKRRKVEAEV